MADEKEIDRIASSIAGRYKKRCWWVEYEDIKQEACRIVCRAEQNYNPEVGIEFGAYAFIACSRELTQYLYRNSAPVSAPNNKVKELAGLHRKRVNPWEHVAGPKHYEDDLRARIRDRVMALAETIDNGEWAVAILLEGTPGGDEPSAELVKQSMRKLKKLCSEDYVLYRLWKQVDK